MPGPTSAADSGELVLPTAGSCMWPWVWPDGHIHVRRCTVAELRAGDIAVWFDGRRLFSHRVVAIDGERFVTRGDNNAGPDPAAEGHQLLGRVTRFSFFGLGWRLDGPVGRAAGRAIVEIPWILPALRRAWVPARRAAGRAVESVLTAGPVRRARRRLPGGLVELVADGARGEDLVRLRARRGPFEVGRARVARDGTLDELWVRNLWRGLGIGRRLLDGAVAESGRRGLGRVRAPAALLDERARRLLGDAGFTPAAGGDLVRDLRAAPSAYQEPQSQASHAQSGQSHQ